MPRKYIFSGEETSRRVIFCKGLLKSNLEKNLGIAILFVFLNRLTTGRIIMAAAAALQIPSRHHSTESYVYPQNDSGDLSLKVSTCKDRCFEFLHQLKAGFKKALCSPLTYVCILSLITFSTIPVSGRKTCHGVFVAISGVSSAVVVIWKIFSHFVPFPQSNREERQQFLQSSNELR